MTGKIEIFVGIQYRDKLSVGPNRVRLGRRAYHWSILVWFEGQYHRFDVTDGIVQDPITLKDINPERVWVYRHNISETLFGIPRYLGSIQINHKSPEVSFEKLEKLFDNVPMPDSTNDRTRDNCVTWTAAAIRALQKAGYCQTFDLNELQDFALIHADRCLADFKNRADPARYPPATNNRWSRFFSE